MARAIDPLPLSVEVTTNEPDGMIEQAKQIAAWAPNINVKIPIHGPEGVPRISAWYTSWKPSTTSG
jgi:transaldolase